MSIKTTQRNATRNQSTADFERENMFLFGNRFQEEVYKSVGVTTIKTGMLVVRNGADVSLATAENLDKVIGITFIENSIECQASELKNVNICISGDIDSGLLVLPSTVTLLTATSVGGKNLKDLLTSLGFVLKNVTENTKFDN